MSRLTKCTVCGRRCWNCRKCNNRTYCDFCNACNLHGQDEPDPDMIRPPREQRGRLFLVQVSFETTRGWSRTFEVRVRSQGLAGAIWKGVREARREHLRPRTRVKQARVSAVAA
jgi:hypothetical protein